MATPEDELTIDDLSKPVTPEARFRELIMGEPVFARDPLAPAEDIEDLSVGEPTLGEKATEAAIGTAEGVARAAPIAGGLYAGGKLGAALGVPLGPGGSLFFGTLGAVAGGASGFMAGKEFSNLFPILSNQDLSPYREGGKTFGESIAFAPLAFGLPVMQGGRLARYLSGIGEGARKYPAPYLASEAIGSATAGVAGGTAEFYRPGEAGPRLAAEVAAGFTPGRYVVNLMGPAYDTVKGVLGKAGMDARQQRAADRLRQILEEGGDDVAKVIKDLNKLPPTGVRPTAGQLTGNPRLQILETSLARNNPEYAAETAEQGRQAFRAYQNLIEGLQDVGTPEALRLAAVERNNMFSNMIRSRIDIAERDAAQKIARITTDTPQARAQIGQIVQSNVESALKDARQYERGLWEQAYKDSLRRTRDGEIVPRMLNTRNMRDTYLDIATTITPERLRTREMAFMNSIMGRFGISRQDVERYRLAKQTPQYLETGRVSIRLPKKETSVSDLIAIRSDLLDKSRQAATDSPQLAGFYSRMADAVLDDMATLNTRAYDTARSFSRSLNDTFTRTFAGDIVGSTKTGADRIPPEILVSKAYGANADVVAQRMIDIEDAVGLMRRPYEQSVRNFGRDSAQAQALKPVADLAEERVVSIKDAQARVLRLAAADSIDPATGKLNVSRLQRFVAENKTMLDRMGITPDLEDAAKAESTFRAMADPNSFLNRSVVKQTAFARLVDYENPTRAITEALNSKRPAKTFGQLVQFARFGGPEAMDGLKSSVYDYAFTKAGGMNDRFSADAFEKALFSPLSPNQPSLVNMLRTNGVMTLDEVKNLRRLINPMKRVEQAMGNRRLLDQVLSDPDQLTEMAMRIFGAKIGGDIYGSGPGSLIAASAGSKAVRDMFQKSPNFMVRGIIEDATKDPTLMALLLSRGVNQAERRRLALGLQTHLAAAGLNYADVEIGEEPAPTVRAPRPMPPAPPTTGVPNLPLKQQGGGQPTPGPQSAAPGNARAALAAMYPNDPLLALAGVQSSNQALMP